MSAQEHREAVAAAEALYAISWCLRAVAQGWALDPRERAAALAILAAGIPGIDPADLAAAKKILAATRRLSGRRDQAAELSVQLTNLAMTRQCRAD
jgi:hypothetical protein